MYSTSERNRSNENIIDVDKMTSYIIQILKLKPEIQRGSIATTYFALYTNQNV